MYFINFSSKVINKFPASTGPAWLPNYRFSTENITFSINFMLSIPVGYVNCMENISSLET